MSDNTGTTGAQPAPGSAPPICSLTKNGAAIRLLWAAEDTEHAERLLKLFRRRKEGPESDALWGGHWALLQKAKYEIRTLTERGGLLFFGQAEALKAADAMQKGGAA